jgi:hypothetical protein
MGLAKKQDSLQERLRERVDGIEGRLYLKGDSKLSRQGGKVPDSGAERYRTTGEQSAMLA